jgi:hypothetical protein
MTLAPLAAAFLLCACRIAFDDIRQLATAALSAADVVRRTTLRRLRETFGHQTKLQVGLYGNQLWQSFISDMHCCAHVLLGVWADKACGHCCGTLGPVTQCLRAMYCELDGTQLWRKHCFTLDVLGMWTEYVGAVDGVRSIALGLLSASACKQRTVSRSKLGHATTGPTPHAMLCFALLRQMLCLPCCTLSCCAMLCCAVLLQDLDFSAVIAPKAEAVFDELADILAPYYMGANAPLAAEDSEADEAADPEGDGSSSSMSAAARAGGVFARLGPALEQLQKYVAKAALLLWLWFDQQCEAMAEEVRVLCSRLQADQSSLSLPPCLSGVASHGGMPQIVQWLYLAG